MNDIKYGKPPFKYDDQGGFITDVADNRVLDLRGWGYLTGKGAGALSLSDIEAAELMDGFGHWVVQRLNS